MAVEATQIANLLAIARHGSFTRAAEEKGMSQPALSNSIALLEQRLGVRVLERSRRGSTLTPYGEILARRAEGIQSLLGDAEAEVRMYAAGVRGPLKIGATPSVLVNLLPKALSAFVEQSGEIDVELIEGLDVQLVPKLSSGEIDLIVGPVKEMFTDSFEIIEEELFDDPFAVGVGPKSEFYGREQLTLEELSGAPWILPRPGSTYRRHIEALFLASAVPWPRNRILSNSLPLLEALVQMSDRITIVSPAQFRGTALGPRIIPLKEAASRAVGFKRRRGVPLSPLAETFVQALRAVSMPTAV